MEQKSEKLKELLEELPRNHFNTYYQSSAGRGKYKSIMTVKPDPLAIPFSWSYNEAKKYLYTLSQTLTPDEAERLNIQFENPALKDIIPAALATTVRGGIQLLKPGQKAPTHKHSPNAFRLVLEASGEGAKTVVEGVELPMKPGDLLLTPNWTWHDHHNDSQGDVIWFDGLDIIFVYWLGGVFYSLPGGDKSPNNVKVRGEDNMSVYGAGVVPNTVSSSLDYDPLFYYPYERAKRSLYDSLNSGNDGNSAIVEYTNPMNAGPVFPSMSLKLVLVRKGCSTKLTRRTENAVFVALEGAGRITLSEGESFDVSSHDISVVPSWKEYRIEAKESDLILFSYSDEPIFRSMKLFRESYS